MLILFFSLQNYTIGGLQKHTTYAITLAAKNLKGLGPNATIELRTEDGGARAQSVKVFSPAGGREYVVFYREQRRRRK